MHKILNKPLGQILTTLLSVSIFTPVLTHADIYISEVLEGSSYNKAIEIANNGNAAVTLTGYELASEYNGWANNYALDGVTIQPNSVWVIAHSSANDAVKALADVTSSSYLVRFSGNDALALLKDGDEHDVFGTFGYDNFNKDQTLQRCEHTLSTNYLSWQWQSIAKDDWSNIGQFNAPVNICVAPPEPKPPEVSVDASIMDIQGNSSSSPFVDAANGVYTSESIYRVVGVVTAIQKSALGNDLPSGFFIQDEVGDDDPLTSDGLFVKAGTLALTAMDSANQENIEVGDQLTVYGTVSENYGWTTLTVSIDEGIDLIYREASGKTIAKTPLRMIDSDESFENTLERYENMSIVLDQEADMTIARTFGFDFSVFRNNLVISHGGINFHPNQKSAPGSEQSIKQRAANEANRVVVETFSKAGNGKVPWFPDFGVDNGQGSTDNYLRVGAMIEGLEGIITYSSSEYRFFTTNQITNQNFSYQHLSDRTSTPSVAAGNLSIATMNVLNLFNSPFGGADNPLETNRGADDADDYIIQRAKIVAAILALDADIIGLMEVENNGFDNDSAVVELVNTINSQLSVEKQYVIARPEKDKRIGTDAISSQLIYRRAKIALDRLDIITMPYQNVPVEFYPSEFEGDWEDFRPTAKYMRNAVTPIFTLNDPEQKKLVISVNHFKSKGSTCWEDLQTTKKNEEGKTIHILEDTDYQGNCENFRVAAANYLGNKLEEYPGYRVIVGDLNSYANEDPVLVLTNQFSLSENRSIKAGRNIFVGNTEIVGNGGGTIEDSFGYVNIVREKHKDTISYSYNDEVGTLDHILITPDVKPFVIDAADWNINSVESTLFQYESRYTGSLPKYSDAFRSSDHDPAVLVLNILPELKDAGAVVSLPDSALSMPEASNLKVGDGYRAIIDLTQFVTSSMQVGERINVVLSDKNVNGVVTNSQLGRVDLTEADITRGWVEFTFQQVIAGSFVVEGFYNDELVTMKNTSVELDKDDEVPGGSLSIYFVLLSFMLLNLTVRRKQSITPKKFSMEGI